MKKNFKFCLFASVTLGCLQIEALSMEMDHNISSTDSKFVKKSVPLEKQKIKIMDEKENEYLNICLKSYENLKESASEKINEDEKNKNILLYNNQTDEKKINEEIEKFKKETTQSLQEALQTQHNFLVPVQKANSDQPYKESEKKYINILSLDGGGFRGLMEAYWLDYLAKETKKQPYEMFDLIAGTSIGGILAMGAVAPHMENENIPILSTQQMIDLFEKNGECIFPQRWKYNILAKIYDAGISVLLPRYSAKPLEEMLVSYFGNRRLKSALTNVIVTSATTEQKTVLFSSFDKATNDYMMFEAARSTSAAPSYFEAFPLILPETTERKYLIDGGMWINNPAQEAFNQALEWGRQQSYEVNKSNMIMLSLGTGQMPTYVQPKNAGLVGVVRPALQGFMAIPSEGIHKSLEGILGDNYRRINPVFKKNIDLDNIYAIELLQEAAKEESNTKKIDSFINGPLRRVLENDGKK